MKIAIGSDTWTKTTQDVVKKLQQQGHRVILFGALKNKNDANWVKAAKDVALAVKNKEAREGILFCWTGTGVAMVASKIPGIRAITVSNKKIARDARAWDHANILALSCFLSPQKAIGIVKTWFETPYSLDADDLAAQKEIRKLETEVLQGKLDK